MLGVAEIFILVAFVMSLVFMLVNITNRNRRSQTVFQPVTNDTYESIRRRIADRFKRRSEFALHVVLFLGLSLAFWFVLPMPKMAALLLSGTWLLVLVAHGVKVWFDEAQERAVDREVARMQDAGLWDKPKRTHMELSDDGELVEMDTWDGEKFKHNSQ